MTTREKARKLLDELPEDELEPIVEILASRGANGSTGKTGRGRDFLISVARGTSGLDLDRLRTVRDHAWRCQDDDGRRISASSLARVQSTRRSLRP